MSTPFLCLRALCFPRRGHRSCSFVPIERRGCEPSKVVLSGSTSPARKVSIFRILAGGSITPQTYGASWRQWNYKTLSFISLSTLTVIECLKSRCSE
ncbi:hypothetical protein DL93DRAFT_2083649 [Clavulina sp. PMI_390]|nr:hypothetical protein DL93DRAFT_2083649 [Clavulina sp. PMI_390]